MQRIIFALTLFIVTVLTPCGSLSAQKYYVYDVKGNVVTMNKKAKTPVAKRQVLTGDTRLVVPQNAHIKLLCKAPRKSYEIETSCSGVLSKLIGAGKMRITDLSWRYFVYLFKKMLNGSDSNSTEGGIGFATYRDLEDILQAGKPEGQDSISAPCDTISVPCDTVAVSCEPVAGKAE